MDDGGSDDEVPVLNTSVDLETPRRPSPRMRKTCKQPSPGLPALMDKPKSEEEEEEEDKPEAQHYGPQPAPKKRAKAKGKAKARAKSRGGKKVQLSDDEYDEGKEENDDGDLKENHAPMKVSENEMMMMMKLMKGR